MTIDLNLLISLNALLEERSVSRAAARLHLSQPTLSTALARLRAHFGDELLARTGNTYRLTPLAEELLESTSHALSYTDRVFDTRPQFIPEVAQREFTLVMSDAQLPIFGRVLAELVTREAPEVRLRFEHSTARLIQPGLEWLRDIDALVLPQGILADAPSVDLYRDRWVCVVSATDPDRGPLTLAEMNGRRWVTPYHPRMPVLSALHRMRQAGIQPHAAISTEDFLAVPHLVAGTDRVGLMPERVARLAADRSGVTIVEAPFELGMLVEAMWWHPVHERDPGHRWLRQTAVRAAQSLGENA
ncbi:LysR family transcriptional regulator [Microbacterium sp. B2969]|uniref:LysR family transcriptional regulator n=1 Tax=Microbacterium alkaliflavum TaxID=3248839 RepID=A0ABW7QEA9_9MICO